MPARLSGLLGSFSSGRTLRAGAGLFLAELAGLNGAVAALGNAVFFCHRPGWHSSSPKPAGGGAANHAQAHHDWKSIGLVGRAVAAQAGLLSRLPLRPHGSGMVLMARDWRLLILAKLQWGSLGWVRTTV